MKTSPSPPGQPHLWLASGLQPQSPRGSWRSASAPQPTPRRLQGWRAQARDCSAQCTLPRAPHPRVLLCALAPGGARRPARLPAAEVTVSPKRSHSPGSMNPDQAPGHRAGRTDSCGRERALGPAQRPRPPAAGSEAGARLLAASRAPARSWRRRSHT